MVRLLDRYILREIFGYFLLALGVFLFILMTPEVLRLSELLAQENVAWQDVLKLFVSVLPGKLTWALPLSVLTGLLLAVSRLAADSEVIAVEASGLGRRALLRPTLAFASGGLALTLVASLWGAPLGARTIRQLQQDLASGQLFYQVKPRVFDESFPDRVLYVQDTEEGGARWRGIFLADLSASKSFKVTVAEAAVVVPDAEQRQLLLHLRNGSTHAYVLDEPDRYSVSTFEQSTRAMPLPTVGAQLEPRRHAELSLGELWVASLGGQRWRSARADLHRRFALPFACLVFGLLAVPLGLLAQRSGRAVGFVLAVGIALSYYFIFLLGDRLAREGNLPPGPGVWLANGVLLLVGVLGLSPLVSRLRLQERLLLVGATLREQLAGLRRASRRSPPATALDGRPRPGWRLPRTLDLYVTRGVLFYFLLLLASLVLIFALFTVLEMVDDIAARAIPWPVVARFVWYLLPQAVYWMCPLALLLAVLVELALLSKRNEVVAIKGAGISLYRVVLPILLVGLLVSGGLFWLDQQYLPYANQRQEALRNRIKGRPPQTTFAGEHRWVYGTESRIYHYAYFDPERNILVRPTLLDLDEQNFTLQRRIYARRANWQPALGTWIWQEGWERSFWPEGNVRYNPFDVANFRDLSEAPSHFRKEVRESEQMSLRELSAYIAELRQSGFDVTRLLVQWHKKIAYPLISLIIILAAFPFGLSMGRRGALGGLALGIALGLSYWVLAFGFFEPLGNLGLLPPFLAGWGANLVFAFGGLYLVLQVDT